MDCRDIRSELALYGDNVLDAAREHEMAGHLDVCPVCRETLSEFRTMRNGLGSISRPTLPSALARSLSDVAAISSRPRMFSFPTLNISAWNTRLMPLAAGIVTSLIFGVGLVNFLMSGAAISTAGRASRSPNSDDIMLASNSLKNGVGDSALISPLDFANQRTDVSAQSPSINPRGALVAVTNSFVRGEMKDDEMVVVARVFGNGLAQITDVVEPARNSQAITDLQRALETDPSSTPFVPATLDGRSDNVQVVLKFRSVNVKTGLRPRRR